MKPEKIEESRKAFFYFLSIMFALIATIAGSWVPVVISLALMAYAINKRVFKFLEGTTLTLSGRPPRVILD